MLSTPVRGRWLKRRRQGVEGVEAVEADFYLGGKRVGIGVGVIE